MIPDLPAEAWRFDDEAEPEPLECEHCGSGRPWSWWHGRGMVRDRWCPPPKVCHACAFQVLRLEHLAEWSRRCLVAGVAKPHLGYSMERTQVQGPDEDWLMFARHCLAQTPPRYGISCGDEGAYSACMAWEPGAPGLMLQGPPGSGKSLLLAMMVRRLLEPEPETAADLGAEGLVRNGVPPDRAARMTRHGPVRFVRPANHQKWQPLVTDEPEIIRREELKWKGDPQPLLAVTEHPLLVLDDLGAVLEGGSRSTYTPHSQGKAREAMARLVDYRYKNDLPLLVATNLDDDQLATALDERTLSRLRALVPQTVRFRGAPDRYAERGTTWRTPTGPIFPSRR